MSCNNSSNINLMKTYVNLTRGGSRLMIVIPDNKCTTGVTLGSVIRYDPEANSNSGQYKLSNASTVATSEVIGIVESINTDRSKNVVIYGSINLSSNSIEDIPVGHMGGSGGSDIYFLSPTSSGKLRNSNPPELNHVTKAVYQTAPHGNGSYTGMVMNYVGYKIDGVDLSSTTATYNGQQQNLAGENIIDPDSNSGVGLLKMMVVNTTDPQQIPDTFLDMSVSHLLPALDYPDYFAGFDYTAAVYTFNRPVSSLPVISRLFVEHAIIPTGSHTVNPAHIGKYIFRQGVTTYYVEIVDYDPVNNAYLLAHNILSRTANVTRTSTEDSAYNYGISSTPSGSISVAGFFKFQTVAAYGFYTPKIIFNGTITDSVSNTIPDTNVIVLMKVLSGTQAAMESFTNQSFETSSLTLNSENVKDILTDLELRLQSVETRLLID